MRIRIVPIIHGVRRTFASVTGHDQPNLDHLPPAVARAALEEIGKTLMESPEYTVSDFEIETGETFAD